MITKFRVRITCLHCNKTVEDFILKEIDVRDDDRFDWFAGMWFGRNALDIYQYHDHERNIIVRFDRLEDE